ncbi:MAG TPA: sulfatase-like hydrolase/transferase [Candidatus Hydrogenedentes bacterium]|nr:sulfatase-like hydrolase/transferase [Candidatus Hydrogenedentota bacterium]
MLVPLHMVTVLLAGGLTGLWARRMLASLGWLSGFESGVLLVAAVCAAWAAGQFAYMAAVRLLKPTRSPVPLLCDMAAQCCALALVPWLLGVSLPMLPPVLLKVEPLLFLGVFLGAHALLKLVVFFAALDARPAGRLGGLGWLACAALALAGAAGFQRAFALTAADPGAAQAADAAWTRVGGTWAEAREVPEGVGARVFGDYAGEGDLVLYAALPDDDGAEGEGATAHMTVRVERGAAAAAEAADAGADITPVHTHEVPLEPGKWTELRLPADALPASAGAVVVAWTGRPAAEWMRQLGVHPPSNTGRKLLVAGPWRVARGADTPSVVLLAVEGLAAENTSLHGYHRDTTPNLKKWAETASVFEQAYTPAPEAAAAAMSLATGLHPLRHGTVAGRTAPPPAGIRTLAEHLRARGYHTAAFTEGRGADGDDLTVESAFSRGFMRFNDVFPMEPGAPEPGGNAPPTPRPAGACVTLDRAAEWVEERAGDPYLLCVRLRELRNPVRLARYGEGFLGKGRTPAPVDIYDTALLDVDRQVGAFLARVEAAAQGRPLLVVVTSLYGLDFTEPDRGSWRRGAAGRPSLRESSLHVPLLMRIPGEAGRTRKTPASLADVLPTVLARAGATPPAGLDGADLQRQGDFRDLISVQGNPLGLSVRSGRWRFTWQSGMDPFTLAPAGEESVVEFMDVYQFRAQKAGADARAREPELAGEFRRQLEAFLRAHHAAQTVQPPEPGPAPAP